MKGKERESKRLGNIFDEKQAHQRKDRLKERESIVQGRGRDKERSVHVTENTD